MEQAERSVQKSVYFKESTWKRLDKFFGRGRVSANIERIILRYMENPEEDRKAKLADINKQLREFCGVYGMKLAIYEEKEEISKEKMDEIDAHSSSIKEGD